MGSELAFPLDDVAAEAGFATSRIRAEMLRRLTALLYQVMERPSATVLHQMAHAAIWPGSRF